MTDPNQTAAERDFDWDGLEDFGAVDVEPESVPSREHLAWLARLDSLEAARAETEASRNGKPAEEERPDFSVATLEDFAGTDEPGATALLGESSDDAVIAEGSDSMVYGDGGAGKTTLTVDLACHFAAGVNWLGIPVARKLRVLLIENEGPRPMFRRKLNRKLKAWTGPSIEGRIYVLAEPWGKANFKLEEWRWALAAAIEEHEIDVVIVGPLTTIGMDEAGTLQEVRAFVELLGLLRARLTRPLSSILVHHENRGGKTSGMWEPAVDTLLHVTAQGNGKTRLFFQKTKWSSRWSKQTLHLRWTDGEGFEVEEKKELDSDAVATLILDAVRADPGTGWSKVEEQIKGTSTAKKRAVRDRLFATGELVNVTKDGVLWKLEERKQARLYVADDPAIQHLRREPGADGAQTE